MSNSSSVIGDLVPYPPKEWEIYPSEQLATHVLENADHALQGELLLNLERSGDVGGQFRFVLGGTSKLYVVLPASAVLQCGGASKFKLNWQLWPKNILLRPNSMTTVWMDFMDRYTHFTTFLNVKKKFLKEKIYFKKK
jgi:hypothetical protein